MKLLHCLFAIYLIVLSCLPCSDKEVSSTYHSHSAQEMTSTTNTDDHSHETTDTCPPFCVCNCCGLQMFNSLSFVTFEFNTPFTEIKSALPSYTSIFASNFYGSIWQPPQIV